MNRHFRTLSLTLLAIALALVVFALASAITNFYLKGGSPQHPTAGPALAHVAEIPLPAPNIATGIRSAPTPLNEVRCLADAIYFEARGESVANQIAVAQVVVNRVRHSAYPSTVCGVVYQGAGGLVCQFSWACEPHFIHDRTAYARSLDLAQFVMLNFKHSNTLPDLVDGATHFHNTTVSPGWAERLRPTATIDGHLFFAKADPRRTRG